MYMYYVGLLLEDCADGKFSISKAERDRIEQLETRVLNLMQVSGSIDRKQSRGFLLADTARLLDQRVLLMRRRAVLIRHRALLSEGMALLIEYVE